MIIGIAGGPASGKSTMAKALRKSGYVVVDCDQVGHALYEPGSDGFRAVVGEFGTGVVGEDGKIDRRALGALVFSDKKKLETLNGIMWPRIADRAFAEARAGAAERGVAFVEAAILTRAGWDRRCDAVWGVVCGEEEAVRRMVGRSGGKMSGEEARKRLSHACPPKDIENASHVIFDSQLLSVEELGSEALSLAEAAGKKGGGGEGEGEEGAGLWEGKGVKALRIPPVSDGTVHAGAAVDEEVVLVDEENQVVGSASRAEMRRRNLRHRASCIFVTAREDGAVLVQKRAEKKDYFPAYWEPAVGGVVVVGEEGDMMGSAIRELAEEVGIFAQQGAPVPGENSGGGEGGGGGGSGGGSASASVLEKEEATAPQSQPPASSSSSSLPPLNFEFWDRFCDEHADVWQAVFEVRVHRDKVKVVPQVEEVAEVQWMLPHEIEASLRDGSRKWTPDGVQSWRKFHSRVIQPRTSWNRPIYAAAGILGVAAAVGAGWYGYQAWTKHQHTETKRE